MIAGLNRKISIFDAALDISDDRDATTTVVVPAASSLMLS
jgi:hypothetical protein